MGLPQELFGPHARVRGVLERVVYTSAETHYTVAELKVEKPGALPVMIIGKLVGVQCGESLDLTGTWVEHPQYGKQFKIETFKAYLPTTLEGMTRYLGSGFIPGIGKKYAQKIVEHFGTDTLQVLSEESARLREIPGVGQQRARAIKKAWDNERALRDVMLTLHGYGVGNAMCLRLVKAYGVDAKKVLEEEPYRVAREVHGLGFKTADKIALNRGLPHDGPQRLEGGLEFALESLMTEGHTAPPAELLFYKAAELLEVAPRL
ncbi:MAG TPA: ATP-dependent RecD-like DNA helicase, partial [Opitutales bacterium]|nr:ATP-dependent RecD-like DNA helicase [Opitutales bacterium]